MINTAEIGTIKKRFIFRPILFRIKKSLEKSKNKINRKVFGIFVISLSILSFGGKQIFTQIDTTLKTYNVLAESNAEGPPLTLTSNLQITNNLENSALNTHDKIKSNALTLDKRSYILDKYFLINHSPLYGTGKLFIAACEKYGAPRDCTTVVAISAVETDLCKYQFSAEMHNCWGFGGAGPNRINFDDFNQSIDRVTKALAIDYGSRYMIDPSLMENKYCGPDSSCIGWGDKVKIYIRKIDEVGRNEGVGSILDLR